MRSPTVAVWLLVCAAGCQSRGEVLSSPPDAGDGTIPCATNAECIDRNGGQPFLCRRPDRTCVALLSADCPTVYAEPEDLRDDGLVVIGATTTSVVAGKDDGHVLDLARRDLKDALGGLAPAAQGGAPRPLAIVACGGAGPMTGSADDENARAATIRGFDHLVDDLRVPAILASGIPSTFVSVAETVVVPKKVAMITTTATAPALSDLADDDLVWRLAPSDLVTSKAVAPFVAAYLEPRAIADGIATAGNVRVAVVYEGPSASAELDVVRQTLRTNGKTAVENGPSFLAVDAGDGLANAQAAIAQIVDLKPALVVHVTWRPTLIAAIEQAWPAAAPRPFHLGARASFTSELAANAPDVPLRQRTFGIGAQPVDFTAADVDAFTARIETEFPDTDPPVWPFAMDLYDAVYLFAYAAASSGAPTTGPGVANGLRRFATPGRPTKFGPLDLPAATQSIAKGQTLDFHGVRGAMYFDARGDRRYDAPAFCWRLRTGGSPEAPSHVLVPSGFGVSGLTGAPQGTATCD